MTRNILVPLDGSTFAEHALPAAIGCARASGAVLHIVQVHQVPFMPLPPESIVRWESTWDESLRGKEQQYLRTIADRVIEQAGVRVRTQLLDGDPGQALCEYARDTDVDLIVMTTHGRGGISRWWLGSVADALVRGGHTPVLLLRPGDDEIDLTTALKLRHMLVPLDGSDLARGILEPAAWLGSLYGARYTLLSVAVPVPPTTTPYMVPELWVDRETVEAERLRTETELERDADALRETGHNVRTAVVQNIAPARAILEYAENHDVDVIALATHGRGGVSRIALGSVADKVLRGTARPVLLYRPQPAESGAPPRRERAGAEKVRV